MNYPNVEKVCDNPHHTWKTKRNDELAKSIKPVSRATFGVPEKHKRIAVKLAHSTTSTLAGFVVNVCNNAISRWTKEYKHRS